jgi:outer membrane protein, multidrug efflux system
MSRAAVLARTTAPFRCHKPCATVRPASAATLVALLLAGCATVGPDYQLPAQAIYNAPAAQRPLDAGTGANNEEVPAGNWWQLYQDPRLDALIGEALVANTELRVAAANLARSEALASEADSAQDIRGGASATAVRAREAGEAYLLKTTIPVENLADAGVRASYQFDLVGGLKRASEAAAADVEASRAALDVARISVAADVALAYAEVCGANHELAVARRSLELQEASRDTVSRLVAGGRKMAVDLPRAAALVEQTRASLPAFEARRRIALYRIAVLSGHAPNEYPHDVAVCDAPPHLANPIPVGDGTALLRRRPDVRQAERRLAGASARIGVATAAFYPSISLGLSAGATGLLEDMGQAPTVRWGIGPLISWTLPSGLEKARLREADANADATLAQFDSTVLKALQETENALALLARDLDRETALRQARNQAAEAARQVATLYRAGRLPYLDDLDAQNKLATAEATLAANDNQVAADQIRLFLALGGGWQDHPEVPPK